jgi:hypothetical protein
MDLRTVLAMAQRQKSIPGLLAMLRGGDPQGVGGQGIPQSVSSTMAASNAMGGGGAPTDDQWGWGNNPASLIAAPPAGWKSLTEAYNQAGMGDGWIFNNSRENGPALERTRAGPQMPHGINPFTDIVYGAGSPGQEGQTSGFNFANPDGTAGPDLFGGKQFKAGNLPSGIPQSLQPWLAPALMRYFYQEGYGNQGGSGINARWTGNYAPATGDIKTWPGITKYDPWGRSMGELPNYSS